MAIITSATVNTLLTGFRGELQATVASITPLWPKIAMEVPSTSRYNTYGFVNDISGMREWIGDRVIHDMTASDYTLKNRKFENTFGIDEDDLEDDIYNIWTPTLKTYATSAGQLPDALVFDQLNNSYTNTCFDAVAFFGSHSWHNKTFKNYNDPGLPFDAANWETTRVAFRKQLGDPGTLITDMRQPFAAFLNTKLTVVAGPALETSIKKVLTSEKIDFGVDNPYKGDADYIISESITSDTFWCVLATGMPIKPLIYQNRRAPRVDAQTQTNTGDGFMKAKFMFGVSARAAAGYGLWQLAFGGNQ